MKQARGNGTQLPFEDRSCQCWVSWRFTVDSSLEIALKDSFLIQGWRRTARGQWLGDAGYKGKSSCLNSGQIWSGGNDIRINFFLEDDFLPIHSNNDKNKIFRNTRAINNFKVLTILHRRHAYRIKFCPKQDKNQLLLPWKHNIFQLSRSFSLQMSHVDLVQEPIDCLQCEIFLPLSFY